MLLWRTCGGWRLRKWSGARATPGDTGEGLDRTPQLKEFDIKVEYWRDIAQRSAGKRFRRVEERAQTCTYVEQA